MSNTLHLWKKINSTIYLEIITYLKVKLSINHMNKYFFNDNDKKVKRRKQTCFTND